MAARGARAGAREDAPGRNPNTLPSNDDHGQARIGAFLQALQQSGWTIGGNLRVDQRWSAGDIPELRKLAAELVALKPDVVIATGGLAVGPLLEVSAPCRSCS